MSYIYLQGLEVESSEVYCWDTDPSALLRSNPIVERFYCRDSVTVSCPSFQFGTMLKLSMENNGEGKLMSSAVDSPVKTSVSQILKQKVLKENDPDCGWKCPESLAKFDHPSFSWRTAQGLLFEDLGECLETFPEWGIMQNGELWALTTAMPPIVEKESGYLPTPVALDSRHAISRHTKPGNHWKWNLGEVVSAENEEAVLGGGRLNPNWVEWLMGWIIGWTDLNPLEMDRFQQWLLLHGKPCQRE